jgi:hypothetical protein
MANVSNVTSNNATTSSTDPAPEKAATKTADPPKPKDEVETRRDKDEVPTKDQESVVGKLTAAVKSVGKAAAKTAKKATDAVTDAAKKVATPKLEVKEQISSKQGEHYTVEFDRPMTRDQAREYLFHEGRVPTKWGSRERDNISGYLVPVGEKDGSATTWKFLDPKGGISYKDGGLNTEARGALVNGRSGSTRVIPDSVGPMTRGAVERLELPPKSGSGLDVSNPKPGVYVWEESGSLYHYSKETGLRGARLGDNETYNRDMRHYVVEKGMDPYAADDAFGRQWDSIAVQTMGAFGASLKILSGGDPTADVRGAVRHHGRRM